MMRTVVEEEAARLGLKVEGVELILRRVLQPLILERGNTLGSESNIERVNLQYTIFLQNRGSRGCSTNSLVIHRMIDSVILFLQNTFTPKP